MDILSEEQIKKIKYEEALKAEIRKAIGSSNGDKGIFKILNSPFVVTFVGASLIAVLGFFLQQQSTIEQKKLAQWEAVQKQKYELLSSFAQEFETTAMIIGSLQKRKIVMREISGKDGVNLKNKTNIGRFKDARDRYEKAWSQYLSAPKFNAFYVRIKAIYSSQKVKTALQQLDDAIKKVQESVTQDDVDNNFRFVNTSFDATMTAMGLELAQQVK